MSKLTVYVTDYTLTEKMDLEQEILDQIDATLDVHQCKTAEEVAATIGDPDAIITQWAPLTREILSGLTKCKVICRNGVGVDNIDLEACKDLGIAVLNVPAYCIQEVADHAVMLGIACCRRLQPTIDFVRTGGWGEEPILPAHRLDQLTFGVLGLGRIGRASAARAKPFFKKVIGFDAYVQSGPVEHIDEVKGSLEEMLGEADVVTLHIPGTPETIKLMNAERFAQMKQGAVLVNTCRGVVVDTDALVDALQSGHLSGAGLDVHNPEPLPQDHPLRSMPNVIITPHVAYYSIEAVIQARRETAENIALFVQGKQPISRLI